jgi:hypothetical protein
MYIDKYKYVCYYKNQGEKMKTIQFFIKLKRTLKSPCRFSKCFIFLIINIFISRTIYPQQIIFKVGDNIIDYLNKNPTQYLTQGMSFIESPDGRVDFLKYKAETSDIDTKFLVQGSTVFGVMQHQNNNTTFLYDITGDGILDVSFDNLFLPFSALSKSQNTKISRNNNLLIYMDNGLKMFNDNAGPYAPGVNNKYLSDYSSNTGISINNRDLFYGILQYYNFARNPTLALMIISEIGIRYEERFGTIHPLILLHTAESLINLNLHDHAIEYIDAILSTNPDFIPAKVYSWQLEKNSAIKQRKYTELKTNYPNHWIVKQI